MNLVSNWDKQGVIRIGDGSFEVGISKKGAVSGVAAGGYIGSKVAGPQGAVVGSLIGGIAGAILGPED